MSTVYGFWLIRITIWLAVASWLTRVFVEACRCEFDSRSRLIRWIWLTGAVAALTHTIAAMGVGHCWSIANAMRHTAFVTRKVLGVELPYSVFVNFAFVVYWLFDATREFRKQHVGLLGLCRQIIWATMMLNGTVVFGPGHWRWIAIPCVGIWLSCLIRQQNGQSALEMKKTLNDGQNSPDA